MEQMPDPQLPAGVALQDEPPTKAADGDSKPGMGLRKDQVPKVIQDALLNLRQKFEGQVDGSRARREYQKKCLKLFEFYRGNQWSWWDYSSNTFRAQSSSTGGQLANTPAGNGQSLYVMNFLQGYLLAIVALLTGNKMAVRAFPEDPSKAEDVVAAERATMVMKIFQRSEMAFDQLRREIFSLCTCGTYGSYIRTVTDGERWGYLEKPLTQLQTVQLGPPRYACSVCGDDLNELPGTCAQCFAPLPPTPNVPPPMAPVPQIVGYQDVPRGRTVRDIVDGLELKLQLDAPDQAAFNIIVRAREMDKAVPRATWPESSSESGSTGSLEGSVGSNNEYDRRLRTQANLGTTVDNRSIVTDNRDRITLTEAWYRPRAFYGEDDQGVREALRQMFPKGVKVSWSDDVFCEAREEEMDKAWRICHALPGRSQVREPILASIVPIQEIANDILNICRDVIEYTLPATFISSRLLDVKKWARSQTMAGGSYNVTDLGRPISDGFFQTRAGQLPEYATVLLDKLRTEIPQFLTGAFPAAYGAGSPGNSTAMGQELQKQSALGRINLFLQAVQEHYRAIAPLVVEDFVNNAIEPISFVEENTGGDAVLTTIHPEDFRTGRFRTEFEVVSEYPTTWAQNQALMLQMFQMPNFQGWAALLKNNQQVKRLLGIQIEAPKEGAYKRQFQIISELLRGAPQQGPPVPAPPDPITGQPAIGLDGQPAMVPGPMVSSTPVFALDDNATMLEACTDFYYSSDGVKAQKRADPGWQNFTLHVQERQTALNPPPPPGMPLGPPGAAAPPQMPPGGPPPPDQPGAEGPPN